MATQYGHRVDNVIVSDEARAHFGDNITKHYHVAVQAQLNTYETLLASLAFDHMDDRVRNVATALPMTSEWLPRHQHFIAWTDDSQMHEHHGFLWIKGKPGSGKSTIMKEALIWAERAWSDQIVLSYFFTARSPHQLEKSSLGLYRSLLHRLLHLLPNSHAPFATRFASKVRKGQVEDWTEIELQNFLVQLIKELQVPPITIFIDALDEGTDNDIRRMITFLECLTGHATAAACLLRICLSSRHYPRISVEKSLSLILEHQAEHDRDIEEYIRRKLAGGEWPGMGDLRRKIQDRSAGIFLWVVLIVPMLNKAYDQGRNAATMLRKLETIPPDLHDVFTQIFLKDLDDLDDLDECITLLQWVLFSKRPLSPIELYHAIQHTYSHTKGDGPVVVKPDMATRYLLNCSRGLVELTETEDPVVQFIHETVRDYLTGGRRLEEEGSRLPLSHVSEQEFSADTCNGKLSEVCLRYMLRSFEKISLIEEVHSHYPLAPYAAEYWWQHLQLSQSPYRRRESNLALELLIGSRRNLLFWVQLYDLDHRQSNPKRTIDDLAPPLYYAAFISRQELASDILALGADVNARGGRYGNALHVASAGGHEKVVRTLLDKGADVNARGGLYGTALQAASKGGHEKVVQTLLDKGADVNAREGLYGNALRAASEGGHEKVVQTLLDKGADVNARGGRYGNPLQAASKGGHEKVVQTLLDKGANVNARGGRYGNALQAASKGGHEKVVQTLLDKGADVHARGGLYGNALHAASKGGHEKVVQTLLDKGADVHARGGLCGNALQAASKGGHEKVVQTLLDKGANVHAREGLYGNALHMASVHGHEKVVQTLLDKGADVHAREGLYGNALHMASVHGHENVVQILIEHEAESK